MGMGVSRVRWCAGCESAWSAGDGEAHRHTRLGAGHLVELVFLLSGKKGAEADLRLGVVRRELSLDSAKDGAKAIEFGVGLAGFLGSVERIGCRFHGTEQFGGG